MVRSMISGVAGLRTHQSKMDVIGNNIANVNTFGFKSARAEFRDSLYSNYRISSDALGQYGGKTASQVGYGTRLATIDTIHNSGYYFASGGPLDSMIDGSGFFLVGPDPEEIGGEAYDVSDDGTTNLFMTRVGSFTFDGSGNLVDSQGNFVYGWNSDGTEVPEPDPDGNTSVERIRYDAETIKLKDISIGSDGLIRGINSEDDSIYVVGMVAIADVPNPEALERVGMSYYVAKSNTGIIRAVGAGTSVVGKLQEGGLEGSNVDLANEFTEMITTQRGYQANSKVITTTDEMLQELVNIKR